MVTVFRAVLARESLKRSRRVSEMDGGCHRRQLRFTLETLIATHWQHRPSIRHRYCGPNNTPSSATRLTPPPQPDANLDRQPDPGSKLNQEHDPDSDRPQPPTSLLKIPYRFSEVYHLLNNRVQTSSRGKLVMDISH